MAQMIVLGIVQGLTEFLPVSSTAHLIFAERLLRIARPGILLEAVLHLGTAAAAVVLFWPDVRRLLAGVVSSVARLGKGPADPYGRLAWLILVATAVTGVIGILLADPLTRLFESVRGTAAQLIVTGLVLLLIRQRGTRRMLDLRFLEAAAIGLAQSISIIPGISRSGMTLAAAVWVGIGREEAARLSFLVAIPALLGAGAYALKDLEGAVALGYGPGQLLVGLAVSLLFGVLAIRWLLDAVRRGRLIGFAVYCWIVGGTVLLAVR